MEESFGRAERIFGCENGRGGAHGSDILKCGNGEKTAHEGFWGYAQAGSKKMTDERKGAAATRTEKYAEVEFYCKF